MTSMCVQEPRQRRSELSSVPFPPFERLSGGGRRGVPQQNLPGRSLLSSPRLRAPPTSA